ncbi:dopamine beta-hydroxylase [Patella vulgata]|uniref:dopamine beta-hydroxylase n=1 Tax=Patella vulgata TaxID=6465 RepID=UPI0024A7AEB9|nr:dopamine beta-hydroxylase [Patella vulgata]
MGVKGCSSLIGLWTLGLPGECVYKEAGFRLGQMGIKRGLLQFHWTNPEERSDLWDASGMTIYYTKKLRKYDAGTWMTGQEYLEIPPLTKNVVQQSTCSSRCTKKIFNGTVHLMTGLNHMHYLGVSGRVKLTREDDSTQMLTDEPVYSYDTPVLNRYEPPVELQGGDSIETVCSYRSLSRKETAVYGRGTYDEMCYGIFTYYPVESISTINCVTRKEFELCDYRENGCDFKALQNFTNPETRQLINRVFATCTHAGGCLHGCRDLVKDIMTNHVCFKDGMAEGVTYRKLMERGTDKLEALQWVAAMKSCECAKENPINYVENNEPGPGQTDNIVPSSNTSQIAAYTVLVLILSALRLF